MEAPPLLAPPLAPSINQERHSPLNLRCEILVYRTVISIEDGQAIPVSFLNQFPCQLGRSHSYGASNEDGDWGSQRASLFGSTRSLTATLLSLLDVLKQTAEASYRFWLLGIV